MHANLASTTARVLAVLAVSAASTSGHAEAPRRLAFGEAIELAMGRAPAVASAREGIGAAEAHASGTSARRYAKLHTNANLLRWDRPLFIDFGPMNDMMGMTGAPAPSGESGRLVVRDRYTSSVAVSIEQPISGLFVLGRMVAIDRSAVAGARANVATSRLDAAQRAAEAYLRVLQSQALAEVAGMAVKQIEAQLGRAETLEAGGVLGRVDVLRLQSTRDAARQSLVRAQGDIAIGSARLALALNLPPATAFDLVDDFPDPPAPVTVSEDDVLRAAAERPELRGAAERIAQARGNRTVALAEWLPNLMAVGTYQHITGQGPFQPRNAWYVGATLSWDVWDWGRTMDGVKEAEARARQAEHDAAQLRSQIAVEVRQRLLEAKVVFASLEPARTSLAATTEAHRIQTVRYQQGLASTTDIIDAETELSRARGAYTQARFEFYLAQAALARAAGALPLGPVR